MADQKLTALTQFTPDVNDILYAVDDPSGSPSSGKITVQSVIDLVPGFSGVLIRKSAAQSIPNATQTALTWNRSDYDTDNVHDDVGASASIITPADWDFMRVTLGVNFGTNSTGERRIMIYKGGTILFWHVVPASAFNRITMSVIMPGTSSEAIQAWVYQNSGAALDVETTNLQLGGGGTFFAAERIK